MLYLLSYPKSMRTFWFNMNVFIKLVILLSCVISAFSYTQPKGKPDLLRVCYYTPGNPPPNVLNTTLCTHINVGFSVIKNGLIDVGNEDKKKLFMQTTDLKKNYPELKVLLSAGGGGSNGGFSEAVSSISDRTKLIFSTLATLGKYNFDGFDIDWEFPVWNDGVKADKSNFISFLKEFRALSTFYAQLIGKPPFLLTVAVAAVKGIITSSYDIPEMAKYVDFINLMSYDYHDYFWYTPFTGHNSPLFNSSREKKYFATLNTAWSANYWYEQGMPKSKIMVGVPTYAHTYILVNPKYHKIDDPAVGTKDDISFPDVCKFLSSGGTRVFDNESQVPYAYKGYDWVSYEDPASISGKAKWIKSEGYGGVMTYNLNSDDFSCTCDKTPFLLHRIIYDIFTH